MSFLNILTVVLTLVGLFFFLAGTLGLLRFPDVYSRLLALTKADNIGLGLMVIGVLPQMVSLFDALQLLLIWTFVMIAGAVTGYLVGNSILEQVRITNEEA